MNKAETITTLAPDAGKPAKAAKADKPDNHGMDYLQSMPRRWVTVYIPLLLFVFVLLGLAIPEQAVILPQHQLFARLGLHNSFPGLVLPGLVGSFGVFFMTQYFKGIPRDLDEAALLDGASRWRIFWRVLMPLTIPAQATLGVFTFLGSWNAYWWPLISATRSDMYTLTVGLASAQMNYAQTSGLGYLMAQAVFASIPIFMVYIVFQKQIVRAMSGTVR